MVRPLNVPAGLHWQVKNGFRLILCREDVCPSLESDRKFQWEVALKTGEEKELTCQYTCPE